jgi:hypothetical protein
MQFNYQNLNVEEEEHDYRNYGLLNKNLVDDEQDYEKYIINVMKKRLIMAEESNKILEDLNKNYVNDIKILTENLISLQKEFNKKLMEIENKNKN